MPDTTDTAARPLHALRVDTVGSLLRPESLKQTFAAHAAGHCTDDDLAAAQDEAIREVVAKQESVGLPVVTDGEFRRRHFNESFADVAGFAGGALAPVAPSRPQSTDAPDAPSGELIQTRLVAAEERLRLVRSRPLAEFSFTQALTERPVKATLLNPDGILQRFDAAATPKDVYPDRETFLADVIAIQREMIRELIDAGCRYIQVDAPRYGAYMDDRWRQQMSAAGVDPDAALHRAIEAENAMIRDFPDSVAFGLHICRGNRRSQWHFEGSYDRLASEFLEVGHDRLLLEYDSERAGGFEPLRQVPPNTVVVLGLITSKTGDLESPDDLKRRIEEASRHVPLDQLALSPQCGFATVLEGNLLTEDAQWRKLEIMLEVADDVWG
jgi:5-methyltetrahydropteroyltriglutamate--homocysteine methyltransferase